MELKKHSLQHYSWQIFENSKVIYSYQDYFSVKNFFGAIGKLEEDTHGNLLQEQIYLKDKYGANDLRYSILNNEMLAFVQTCTFYVNLRSVVQSKPVSEEIVLFKYLVKSTMPMRIHFGSEKSEISQGTLFVCNHLSPHVMDIPKNTEFELLTVVISTEFLKRYLVLNVDADYNLLKNFINEQANKDLFVFHELSYQAHLKIMEIYKYLKQNTKLASSKFTLLNLITDFLLLFYNDSLNITHKQNIHKEVAYKAAQYLNNSLETPFPGIDFLAKHLFVSPSTLNRSFKMEFNTTPLKYFMERKILKAVYYLQNTNLNISEISFKLGFPNPSDFARSFKKIHQDSPSEMREKNKVK